MKHGQRIWDRRFPERNLTFNRTTIGGVLALDTVARTCVKVPTEALSTRPVQPAWRGPDPEIERKARMVGLPYSAVVRELAEMAAESRQPQGAAP